MVRLRAWGRNVGLAAALAGSLAWGFASTSCVLPDQCILVVVPGHDWCSDVLGARMWPVGSPDLAVPVLDGADKWPRGCRCYNAAEGEILFAGVPLQKYEQFAAEIETAARNNCDAIVPVGWDHDCYELSDQGPSITAPEEYGFGTCVGDCAWTNEPKSGCGDDPTPYDCEQLGVGDTGDETGSEGETGGAAGGSDTTRTIPTPEPEVQWDI